MVSKAQVSARAIGSKPIQRGPILQWCRASEDGRQLLRTEALSGQAGESKTDFQEMQSGWLSDVLTGTLAMPIELPSRLCPASASSLNLQPQLCPLVHPPLTLASQTWPSSHRTRTQWESHLRVLVLVLRILTSVCIAEAPGPFLHFHHPLGWLVGLRKWCFPPFLAYRKGPAQTLQVEGLHRGWGVGGQGATEPFLYVTPASEPQCVQ